MAGQLPLHPRLPRTSFPLSGQVPAHPQPSCSPGAPRPGPRPTAQRFLSPSWELTSGASLRPSQDQECRSGTPGRPSQRRWPPSEAPSAHSLPALQPHWPLCEAPWHEPAPFARRFSPPKHAAPRSLVPRSAALLRRPPLLRTNYHPTSFALYSLTPPCLPPIRRLLQAGGLSP